MAVLEAALGVVIPSDCREVIASGGAAFDRLVSYEDHGGRVTLGWLMNAAECLDAWQSTQGSLEESLLPFADDGGDNLLCLAVKGRWRGQVFFHHHCVASLDPGDVDGWPTSATLVAPSYAAFVDSLRPQ